VNFLRKSTLVALLVSTLCVLLSVGCNTTKGLGKDVERAGEKIQENASR
jgi:predicted small secreted protein